MYNFRSSTQSAAAAFAVAVAASSNPPDRDLDEFSGNTTPHTNKKPNQETIISTAATMRVLNVLRHWVSKHYQVNT